MIDYSGEVLIGNNVVISESSIILSHEHDIPELQARTEKKPIPKRTEIKAFAWIGAGATILPGRVIGEHAVVGAGSVVTHDVEPYDIVAGNPAKSIKKRKGSTDIG
ncbi:MAG: acyltransferase [Synergistaceae bacterium]|nr:acyltransferase [Synergistaceae bacterium]